MDASSYDGVVFTLAIFVDVPVHATDVTFATQKSTVPGLGGHLVAFDGTFADATTNSDIKKFATQYGLGMSDQPDYQPGVGSNEETILSLLNGAIGAGDAQRLVDLALVNVNTFYSNPKNWGVPLDVIGFSRGCFEAVKFENIVARGLAIKGTSRRIFPVLRFVGLISPVGELVPVAGPLQGIVQSVLQWPTALPAGVAFLAEALDANPTNLIYWETDISVAGGTAKDPERFSFFHQQVENADSIGYQETVLIFLEADAGHFCKIKFVY